METINKVLHYKSTHHMIRPFVYEAQMRALYGHENKPVKCVCQADTICGLISYLIQRGVLADDVKLFGVYSGKSIELDKTFCTNANGQWIDLKKIHQTIEDRYEEILAQNLQIEWQKS
ncbi:MAG: hypothetical protein DWQ10_16420 [Calditrichaeota bacterium]|nr:MAG: hypothetical protein DWQ10_16420 [Calditrichota bacterium]